jgi:hypothetical protein
MEIVKVKLKNLRKTSKISPKKKYLIKASILKNKYDYRMGYIFVDKNYKIINGHHRYQSLLEINGREYEIYVKKTNKTYFFYYLTFIMPAVLIWAVLFYIIWCNI